MSASTSPRAVTRDTAPERFARVHTRGAALAIAQRLHASAGVMVTKEALIFAAYGANPEGAPENPGKVIDVVICRLRKTLPPGSITTIWGQGFRLAPGVLKLPPIDDAHVVLARSSADERAIRAAIRRAKR